MSQSLPNKYNYVILYSDKGQQIDIKSPRLCRYNQNRSPCHRARPGHARAPVGGSCPSHRASPGVRDAGHGTGTNVPDLE